MEMTPERPADRHGSGSPAPTYVARGPGDLIALVPFMLGFHPADSLVVMTFGNRGRRFHARVDLPADVAGRRAVAAHLASVVIRHHQDRVALLLYTRDAEAARSQGELLLELLLKSGVSVIDVLRVDAGRYWFALEGDVDGTAFDLTSHPFTADRVFAGDVVQPSRAALAESLVGEDGEDIAAVDAVIGAQPELPVDNGRLRREARWIQQRLRRHVRCPGRWSVDDVGRLLHLVQHGALSEVAWAEVSEVDARTHAELWAEIVRRCPPAIVPAPAVILAFAAWLDGHGALAWCAVERALTVDPHHRIAQTMAELLEGAVSPDSWTPTRESQLQVFATEKDLEAS